MTKLIIVSLLLGIVIGVGTQHYYPAFPFEEQIDIVEFATLLVTIFLAVYIPNFLEKSMHNKRSEKNVIIRKIETLQETVTSVNRVVTECVRKSAVSKDRESHLIHLFTTIAHQLDTIITLSEYSHKNIFQKEFEEIKNFRYQYKNIVTGGSFQEKGFKYTILQQKKQEKIYQSFDKSLSLLIFKVNKM